MAYLGVGISSKLVSKDNIGGQDELETLLLGLGLERLGEVNLHCKNIPLEFENSNGISHMQIVLANLKSTITSERKATLSILTPEATLSILTPDCQNTLLCS